VVSKKHVQKLAELSNQYINRLKPMSSKTIDSIFTDNNMMKEIGDFHKLSTKEAIKYFINIFNNSRIKDEYKDFVIVTDSLKPTEFCIYATKNGKPVASALFEQTGITINNKEYFGYIAKYTLNWGGTKGFMYNAYKAFSKYMRDAYIVSDAKQSKNSKRNWLNWYHTKRNVKEIFSYDEKEGAILAFDNIDDSWCEDSKYRLVIKFT